MQQKGLAEINSFVAGFVSDASPLTFPPNTAKVDVNMQLNTNGSRQRAFGIDYEEDFVKIDTGIVLGADVAAVGTFRWENVSGDPEKNLLCVQVGNQVKFFSLDNVAISQSFIGTRVFSSASPTQRFSFSAVDGNLIVADGTNLITIVSYVNNVLSYRTDTIKVRDFFGVEDFSGPTDLTIGQGLIVRPNMLTPAHTYNLRNQSFATPRLDGNEEVMRDPITAFFNKGGVYPSNADNVQGHLYPDANDGDDRLSYRYFALDSLRNPIGTMRAAQGYYIIDLLARGASRIAENNKNQSTYPTLSFPITSLPEDRTPGGATVVGEFAGRVWYGGFSGEVVGGDGKSPKLSSYVAFSKLVSNPSEVTLCYQEGDPTTTDAPDIIDTDGGFIRISNAYGIKALINLGSDLMVGASNGWWRIFGGNDSGFSASNYVVSKITDKGIRGTSSVVQAEDTLFYWSDDGIYNIAKNQLGDWSSTSISQGRIQTFYDLIPLEEKVACNGVYDSFQKTVRWLYQNRLNNIKQQKELVFSVELNAFYERHISQISPDNPPILAANFKANSFKLDNVVSLVTVDSVAVTVGGNLVTESTPTRSDDISLYETGYMVITDLSPTIKYTFAAYTDLTFTDWAKFDGVGVDAPSILITGTAGGGDNFRQKQVPYITVHMRRTEDGFSVDENGDWIPNNQSSCILQGHWDWTNSVNSNKWTQPFQVYRYKRQYFPDSLSSYDTGYETVVTKNKLRGRGRSVALKFSSEPKKEMHIYGWSMFLGMNQNV